MTALDDTEYTPEELEAIEKLKSRLQNDVDTNMYEDTYMFYRFLKARDFNLSQAEIMLRKNLQWRKINKMDTIITDYKPPEVLEKYIPYNKIAVTSEGSICRYIPVSNFDSKGLHMSVKYSDIEKHMLQIMEMDEKFMKESAKDKKGAKLPGYIYIYDMKDLSFALATDKKGIEDFIRSGKIIQDNYPERLKQVVIINVSKFFSIPFSILKKFLAPNIIKKIKLYSTDGWQEHLLNLIGPDDLPAFLGGNKTDPDGNPLCESFINFAGPIPESYYMKKGKMSLYKDPRSKKLVLPRAAFSEIALDVRVPGSLIEWEFETKSKDIAFGLFFKEIKDEAKEEENDESEKENISELIPLIRLDTELCSETGVYKCEKPGTYVMLFDNSYSWIRSKEIYYKTSVVSPKELEAQLEN